MPGQPKYCEECKGYGNLYEQKIVRYGDKRIKENTPVEAKECVPCKGTGMITLQTEKVSVFDVQDQADNIITETKEDDAIKEQEVEKLLEDQVEKIDDAIETIQKLDKVVEGKAVTDEEMQEENDAIKEQEDPGADIDIPSEAPEPTEEDEEVVFEPKHVEMEEGDMPI